MKPVLRIAGLNPGLQMTIRGVMTNQDANLTAARSDGEVQIVRDQIVHDQITRGQIVQDQIVLDQIVRDQIAQDQIVLGQIVRDQIDRVQNVDREANGLLSGENLIGNAVNIFR